MSKLSDTYKDVSGFIATASTLSKVAAIALPIIAIGVITLVIIKLRK
jgi:hypothetical protein